MVRFRRSPYGSWMTPIVVALVSFAIALCLGWVLSKAYFRTQTMGSLMPRNEHEQMQERYRKRLLLMHKLVRRHEATQSQIKDILSEIQKAHDIRKEPAGSEAAANAGETQGELSELLTRLSERNGEIADLRAQIEPMDSGLETEPKSAAEMAADDDSAQEQAAILRAELGAVRAELSSHERQAQELQRKLNDSETQRQELRATLDSWKQRVSPLTKKLKQQRAALRVLRDEFGEHA